MVAISILFFLLLDALSGEHSRSTLLVQEESMIFEQEKKTQGNGPPCLCSNKLENLRNMRSGEGQSNFEARGGIGYKEKRPETSSISNTDQPCEGGDDNDLAEAPL